jgi:hypothetical protein
VSAAEDHLGALEAEAMMLRSRIRTLADAGELDDVMRLYRRIPELRLELLAARHVVARTNRRERRYYGENPELNRAEHALAIELNSLGVETPPELRQVLG